MIWTMTLRCFLTGMELAMGGLVLGEPEEDGAEGDVTDPRRAGGVIFSNVKAGIVHPLVVELKHSLAFPWGFPLTGILSLIPTQRPRAAAAPTSSFTRTGLFNHSLEQLQNFHRIAELPTHF